MSRCQDCEDGRCECGLPQGCEGCQHTGACTTCNGVHRLDRAQSLDFSRLPLIIRGMHPRALRMMRKCQVQRRRLAKAESPIVAMPNLWELREGTPTSGSCSLCGRYHTSGTARKNSNPESVGYQRGVARFRNTEWCPQCVRPFNKRLGRPYAKIGPPPWG